MTRKKHSWKKTWILPELKAKKGRWPLKAFLSRAGKTELGSKSWPSELSVGQVLVKYRPSGGEVSAGCRPTCLLVHVDRHATDTQPTYQPSVGQYIAECRSPYRPIVSTDTRSTDALSTHDPIGFHMSAESTVNHFSFGFTVLCPVSGYLHFVLAKNNCFEFWSVHLSVCDLFHRPELLLCNTQLKTAIFLKWNCLSIKEVF